MKNVLKGFILVVAIAAGSMNVFPALSQTTSQEDQERQRNEANRQQQLQQMSDQLQKDRDTYLRTQQQKSDNDLNNASSVAAAAKAKENDVKFADLQQAAKELLLISQRLNAQVNASGAQSVSIGFFTDLNDAEKIVKKMRKSAK